MLFSKYLLSYDNEKLILWKWNASARKTFHSKISVGTYIWICMYVQILFAITIYNTSNIQFMCIVNRHRLCDDYVDLILKQATNRWRHAPGVILIDSSHAGRVTMIFALINSVVNSILEQHQRKEGWRERARRYQGRACVHPLEFIMTDTILSASDSCDNSQKNLMVDARRR